MDERVRLTASEYHGLLRQANETLRAPTPPAASILNVVERRRDVGTGE